MTWQVGRHSLTKGDFEQWKYSRLVVPEFDGLDYTFVQVPNSKNGDHIFVIGKEIDSIEVGSMAVPKPIAINRIEELKDQALKDLQSKVDESISAVEVFLIQYN
jgi:hypothetical protein